MTTTRAERRRAGSRRPLLRSLRFWIPVALVLVLLVTVVIVGMQLYDRGVAAKASLERAMPLASRAAEQIAAGESDAARKTAAELAELTADARAQTDGSLWRGLEWLPVAGPNLQAVRTAAAVTDDLVRDALTPAAELSLDGLRPKDGAVDLAAITQMQAVVDTVSQAVDKAQHALAEVDRSALIDQVDTAVGRLTDAVDELQPMIGPARDILGVLPEALGAEKPRHYLMIFQNNAEARGTGGNPAALVMLEVDKGRISISRQASSADFKNHRPEPIMPLDPQTEAIYGDKIGRWISDATLTPDFTETAQIVRAWWAEEFGTPIDAVISFDPVALSYLLQVTGPAVVPNDPIEVDGRELRVLKEPLTLTADNAVPFLLSQVYWEYDEGPEQDAVFAASARAVFDVLTTGGGEPKPLVDALARAVDEGRLMYQPATESEAELLGESRLSGKLPSSNAEVTTLGAYVNDFTEGKLDYYLQLDLAATSTQCTSPDAPTFTVTASLTNTVSPSLAPSLPYFVHPARFFPKGHIATNLAVYGPVGSTQAKVTVDGKPQSRAVHPHLGRSMVLVPVYNAPGQKHTVTVEFQGAKGDYGPLEVRHTPMVRDTPLDLSTPGCG